MTKISTTKGSLTVDRANTTTIKTLQNILPYGVFPFKETFDGADFGIVMQCGNKELNCIKLQPLEVEREQAERLFQLQHLMIIDAYCDYIKLGFSGGYLALPYLRQRDNGRWEAGISNFIFPGKNNSIDTTESFRKTYDFEFGEGATNMFMSFVDCFKKAFSNAQLTMPQYLGMDLRPRSHLKSLGMYFMVLDNDIICLRNNLRQDEDPAWAFLISHGIEKVYHLPSLPMTIEESDFNVAKGMT